MSKVVAANMGTNMERTHPFEPAITTELPAWAGSKQCMPTQLCQRLGETARRTGEQIEERSTCFYPSLLRIWTETLLPHMITPDSESLRSKKLVKLLCSLLEIRLKMLNKLKHVEDIYHINSRKVNFLTALMLNAIVQ